MVDWSFSLKHPKGFQIEDFLEKLKILECLNVPMFLLLIYSIFIHRYAIFS